MYVCVYIYMCIYKETIRKLNGLVCLLKIYAILEKLILCNDLNSEIIKQ